VNTISIMKLINLLHIFILSGSLAYGQELTINTELSDSINESSGLVLLNDRLITINDSGGDPALYEVDTLTGGILRTVVISNASNVDWEEITMDDEYLYVCDIGNNNGSRTNLVIYRVQISDYLNAVNDSVVGEPIHYSYSDQTDFNSSPNSTNFDAEAALVIGDSIYIFTKNWNDYQSNVYVLPKIPGTYSAAKIASIDAQGLITGVCYNTESGSVVLTGYTFPSFFIIELSNFMISPVLYDDMTRYNVPIPLGYSTQGECITFVDASKYYFTCEESFMGSPALYSFTINNLASVEINDQSPFAAYPNPAKDVVYVTGEIGSVIQIYGTNGRLVYGNNSMTTNELMLDVSNWQEGIYIINQMDDVGRNTTLRI
jgi:Secretion system C-terminal sorting domain